MHISTSINSIYILYFLAILAISFMSHKASARGLNCDLSCNSQCAREQWWNENYIDLGCYSACAKWVLPNCYDNFKNQLRNDIWGELGPNLYVLGATIIEANNAQGVPLTEQQQLDLKNIFMRFIFLNELPAEYKPFIPEFLGRVSIHWNARMLDELKCNDLPVQYIEFCNLLTVGSPSTLPMYNTPIHNGGTVSEGSGGQTFGLSIYISNPQNSLNKTDETVLLAHELVHTLQYLQRGSSLHAFGNDYFRGFESSGYNYASNPMEKEAFDFDEIVSKWLASSQTNEVDHWNFQLCNDTNLDSVWVTIGHFTAAFSLIPIKHSTGWFQVRKGKERCETLLKDIRAGDKVWYYATSNRTGIYPANKWGSGFESFCVDTENIFDFEYGYRCNKPTESYIHSFTSVPPPQASGGTYTLTLTDGIEHTVVRLCNTHPQAVMVAQLAYEPRNGWISRGWTSIGASQCVSTDFGITTNKAYYYATTSNGLEWPITKSTGDVKFCVRPINEGNWSFLDNRWTKCEREGGALVNGQMIATVPGVTTVDINPSQTTHMLNIKISHTGVGAGSVTSLPAGLNCKFECSANFNGGIVSGTVTLTATPNEGSNFAGWTGCPRVIGSNQCAVVMTQDKTIEALFTDRPVLVVDRRGKGSGIVLSNPPGIDCGFDCIEDYDFGDHLVRLQAKPDRESIFTGWFGINAKECAGDSNGQINVNAFKYCIAQFDTAPTDFLLTISKTGDGTGTVFSSDPGIDCGEACAHNYPANATLEIIPLAERGSVFRSWNGACSGTGVCTVTMYAKQNISASFAMAHPAEFTVTNLDDSGAGSLRQAVLDANSNPGDDVIKFKSGLNGTIVLTTGQLAITDSVVMEGPGANVLAISGNRASRIFTINPGIVGTVAINGLTLKEGRPQGFENDNAEGGGAVIVHSGTVTIDRCTLSDNSAGPDHSGGGGGAIRKFGPGKLTVSHSTLTNNSALNQFGEGAGGGVRNDQETLTIINSTLSSNSAVSGGGVAFDDGRLVISNSTITGNTASSGGGGIFTSGGELLLGNSLVAGNQAPADQEVQTFFGRAISQGHNLFGANGASGVTASLTLATSDAILPGAIGAVIGPLADNGGSTRTHLPVIGGPAVDAGDNQVILDGVSSDQRGAGFPRIMNGTVDIGAVEVISTQTLTVTKGGGGKVSSVPQGIDCGSVCTYAFTEGTQVTLTATPNSGVKFSAWNGACSGNEACLITMDQAKSVTAVFGAQLTVTKSGDGSGRVTTLPAGIDCGAVCDHWFRVGTQMRDMVKFCVWGY